MSFLNKALLAGAIGLIAAAAGAPKAQAEVFNFSISQGDCGGNIANCGALSTDPLATGSSPPLASYAGVVVTGTYTNGSLDFLYPGTSDQSGTIGGFLATGAGAWNTISGAANLTNALSVNPFGLSTLFHITVNLASAANITGTTDDGWAVYQGGVLLTPTGSAAPREAATDTFFALAGLIDIYYVATNGLPEQLSMEISYVPLPGTVWLFGAGLAGIGLLTRRRKNKKAVPALAA